MKIDAVNSMYNTPKVNFTAGKFVKNTALETIQCSRDWKFFKEGPFSKLLESDLCSGEYSFFYADGTGFTSYYGVSRNGKIYDKLGYVNYWTSGDPSYYFDKLMDALKTAIAEDILETRKK